ncbi:uncharacterized protein LOC126986548 [Eriocheir sinensis]|uniref:uncharacterized protein LOC126986548 n=1 Tax=Eriocheir sinensis TaxID=95602 RepID=UPI0021C86901|nr:uncharacterized protein LOC126986548 [Eriocheir sinensis]
MFSMAVHEAKLLSGNTDNSSAALNVIDGRILHAYKLTPASPNTSSRLRHSPTHTRSSYTLPPTTPAPQTPTPELRLPSTPQPPATLTPNSYYPSPISHPYPISPPASVTPH